MSDLLGESRIVGVAGWHQKIPLSLLILEQHIKLLQPLGIPRIAVPKKYAKDE